MRKISVINQKGGVGKTTTTAHLGAALALTGSRVLLIDLDPQAHLSLHFGVEVAEDQPSIYDVLTSSLPIREAVMSVHDSLHLVPSDIDLAAAEAELISVMGREVILREALTAVDSAYDVLLIDCPPSLGILTINALSACSEVVIPLQAQFFALQGLGKLLDTVLLVQQRINPDIVVKGVALCMHDSSTKLSNEIVEDLSDFLSSSRDSNVPWSRAEIFKTRIRRNVKIAESSSFGQTVFDYEPKSNGAIDYNRLAIDIFNSPCVPGLEDTLPKIVEQAVIENESINNDGASSVEAMIEVATSDKAVQSNKVIDDSDVVDVEAGNTKIIIEDNGQSPAVVPSNEVEPETRVAVTAQTDSCTQSSTTHENSTPTTASESTDEMIPTDISVKPVAPTSPPSTSPETVGTSA